MRTSNTSNIFLRLLAHRLRCKLRFSLLCVIPSTCSIIFCVVRSRRYFYSLQHKNLLSRYKVICAINSILPCNVALCASSCRKTLLVLLLLAKNFILQLVQKHFAWGAVLKFYGGNFWKVNSINFWHKNVVRGNAVQICSDFPAKRLSIFLKNFSGHLFNENYLIN